MRQRKTTTEGSQHPERDELSQARVHPRQFHLASCFESAPARRASSTPLSPRQSSLRWRGQKQRRKAGRREPTQRHSQAREQGKRDQLSQALTSYSTLFGIKRPSPPCATAGRDLSRWPFGRSPSGRSMTKTILAKKPATTCGAILAEAVDAQIGRPKNDRCLGQTVNVSSAAELLFYLEFAASALTKSAPRPRKRGETKNRPQLSVALTAPRLR